MSKNLLRAAAMLAVLVAGSMLYAQMSQNPGPMGPGPGPQAMPPTPEQRLQHMTRDLNLTEAQQQQIKPLLESESDQMRTLQQDSSLAPPDRNTKMRQLRQGTNDQIRPILTAEQQKKFDEMQSHHPHHDMQIH